MKVVKLMIPKANDAHISNTLYASNIIADTKATNTHWIS